MLLSKVVQNWGNTIKVVHPRGTETWNMIFGYYLFIVTFFSTISQQIFNKHESCHNGGRHGDAPIVKNYTKKIKNFPFIFLSFPC